ncbi:hypothetical protein BDF14DRAFT_1956881 [Spinellus fusiger]|nr:hypothetical protein BDF14DRAFT_1956881 [Spinellus fusiger]
MRYSIPVVILNITAQHLETLDHIQCAQVNRTWANSFAHILYKTVLIRTQRQFKLFYKTLLQTSFLGHGLGYLVRHLTIEETVGFTDKEFNRIIECCPDLLSIDFNPKLWRYLHSPSRLNTLKYIERLPMFNEERHADHLIEEHGHRLTQLRLGGAILSNWLMAHRLGSILSFAPKLKRLDLTGEYPTYISSFRTRPRLTMDTMELIHSTCPHLEHLELSTTFLEPTDLTKDRVISPASTMRVFHLHDIYDHWKDMHYFIRKYPHLEEFSSSSLFYTGLDEMPTDFELENNDNLYMAMAQQWSRLRSFNGDGIPSNLWPGKYFFEALQSSGASLTTLRLDFCNAPGDQFDDYSQFKALLASSQHTLETLNLDLWEDCDMSKLFFSLGQCQRLTSLALTGSRGTVFTLDLILDVCPLLKTLFISGGELTLSDKYYENSPQIHPYLSELFIYNLILDMLAATNHLSIRCPHLSSLNIFKAFGPLQ